MLTGGVPPEVETHVTVVVAAVDVADDVALELVVTGADEDADVVEDAEDAVSALLEVVMLLADGLAVDEVELVVTDAGGGLVMPPNTTIPVATPTITRRTAATTIILLTAG